MTIAEIAVHVRVIRDWTTVGPNIILRGAGILIIRDVLSSSVTISDGEMGVAVYTFVSPVYPNA